MNLMNNRKKIMGISTMVLYVIIAASGCAGFLPAGGEQAGNNTWNSGEKHPRERFSITTVVLQTDIEALYDRINRRTILNAIPIEDLKAAAEEQFPVYIDSEAYQKDVLDKTVFFNPLVEVPEFRIFRWGRPGKSGKGAAIVIVWMRETMEKDMMAFFLYRTGENGIIKQTVDISEVYD